MIALPWLAPELQHLESDPEGLVTFSDTVEQYLALRPNSSSQDALNPFTLAATTEDALSLGGSGSTSFLPEVGVTLLATGCVGCLPSCKADCVLAVVGMHQRVEGQSMEIDQRRILQRFF